MKVWAQSPANGSHNAEENRTLALHRCWRVIEFTATLARDQLEGIVTKLGKFDTEIEKNLSPLVTALSHESKENVLSSDVAVPELQGLTQ